MIKWLLGLAYGTGWGHPFEPLCCASVLLDRDITIL